MLNVKTMKITVLKELKFNACIYFFVLLFLLNSKAVYASAATTIEEVDAKKDFVVTFTEAVKQTSVNNDNVFIKTSDGSKVANVDLKLSKDGMSLNILAPEEGYKKGETYTLVITQDLLSEKSNKNLKRLVEKKFKIAAGENKDYELNKKVDEIIASIIKPEMPDYQKELLIHDYIVKNTKYDTSRPANYKGLYPEDSYTAYGVLVKGTGVCLGYARAMKLLLNKVGIGCEVITGMTNTNNGHAWNIVKLGDEYYHVDATFDDPVPDRGDKVKHEYFNVTDAEMSGNRKWNASQYPLCNGNTYDYWFCNACIANNIVPDNLMKIKGTIYLPENEVADKNGLNITLNISSAEYNGYYSRYKTVTIPAGKNSVEYSTLLPFISPFDNGCNLSYVIKDYNGASYIDYGYYSSSGFTLNRDLQCIIKEKDNTIPVNIIKAETISGKVYLPDGKKASDDMYIYVYVCADNSIKKGFPYDTSYVKGIKIKIPKGSDYGNYVVPVPKGEGLYFVQCDMGSYVEGILRGSMYFDNQGSIWVSAGSRNINMTLQSGKVIKGSILLLDKLKSDKASNTFTMNPIIYPTSKDLTVEVECGYYDSSKPEIIQLVSNSFYIKDGESSVPYSLTIPKEYEKVFIHYYFWDNKSYYLGGYYNEDLPHDEATPPLINLDNNVSNIDLKVNKGVELKGSIFLLNNELVPVGGISIEVCADNGKDKYYSYVTISGGQSSIEYICLVKKDRKYKLSYKVYKANEDSKYPISYYNNAIPIEVLDKDIENINLELPNNYNVKL